jgi:hypothetical protein
VISKSTSQRTGHKTRRCRARAHVPARAQASSVVQCRALRMPSHRRSEVHDPLKPTMGTCAPGNASPGLSNARLGQTPRWYPTLPRLRVSTTKRAARHCAAALRRLRATSQSRYLVNHRPPTARPALAPGTAALARVNARLTRLFWLASVHEKSALRVHQSERWSAVTEGHGSLRIVLRGGSGPLTVSHTLRFYITPHFAKCPAVRSQARSAAGHRFAPFGFAKQALCKVSDLGGAPRPQKRGPFPASFLWPGRAAWCACVAV